MAETMESSCHQPWKLYTSACIFGFWSKFAKEICTFKSRGLSKRRYQFTPPERTGQSDVENGPKKFFGFSKRTYRLGIKSLVFSDNLRTIRSTLKKSEATYLLLAEINRPTSILLQKAVPEHVLEQKQGFDDITIGIYLVKTTIFTEVEKIRGLGSRPIDLHE